MSSEGWAAWCNKTVRKSLKQRSHDAGKWTDDNVSALGVVWASFCLTALPMGTILPWIHPPLQTILYIVLAVALFLIWFNMFMVYNIDPGALEPRSCEHHEITVAKRILPPEATGINRINDGANDSYRRSDQNFAPPIAKRPQNDGDSDSDCDIASETATTAETAATGAGGTGAVAGAGDHTADVASVGSCDTTMPVSLSSPPPIIDLGDNLLSVNGVYKVYHDWLKLRDDGVRVKYCHTCHIWRPPGTTHCSICGYCIQHYDHHCNVLGNCVGQGNHLFFTGFLLACALDAAMVVLAVGTSLYDLDFPMDNAVWSNWRTYIDILCGVVYTYIAITLGVFGFMHVTMMLTGTTTKHTAAREKKGAGMASLVEERACNGLIIACKSKKKWKHFANPIQEIEISGAGDAAV